MKIRPAPELLHELLVLNVDGSLTWRRTVARARGGRKGMRAGYYHPNGRVVVKISGQRHFAHHVIWAMTHGAWPAGEIDHINRNPTDNRPENLRACSRAENCANTGAQSRNKLGVKGVSYDAKRRKYSAEICAVGVRYKLGRFDTLSAAQSAYTTAASKYHGDFAAIGV